MNSNHSKKSFRLKTILALAVLFFNKVVELKSKTDSGVIAATTVGSAVVAGCGLYQLFSTFCCSNDSLIDQGCKELMNAKIFTEEILLLDKDLKGLTNIEKKQFILSIDESFCKMLINASQNKIIDDHYYLDLKKNIKNLKFYQTKIPKRIRKLEKGKNKTKYTEILKDFKELVNRIDIIVPKLDLLYEFITTHKNYYELDESIEKVLNNFEQELKLLSAKKVFLKDIKTCIYNKYSNSIYPLIDYVASLDHFANKLTPFIRKAKKYLQITEKANIIQNKLLKLHSLISQDREYILEKRSKDNALLADTLTGFITGTAIGLAASVPKRKVILVEDDVIISDDEIIIVN